MASLTYHIKAEELDAEFIKSIKRLFKNQRISITIEAESDAALEKFEALITQREKEGAAYAIPGEAFERLVEEASQNEHFDVLAALKKFKTAKDAGSAI